MLVPHSRVTVPVNVSLPGAKKKGDVIGFLHEQHPIAVFARHDIVAGTAYTVLVPMHSSMHTWVVPEGVYLSKGSFHEIPGELMLPPEDIIDPKSEAF